MALTGEEVGAALQTHNNGGDKKWMKMIAIAMSAAVKCCTGRGAWLGVRSVVKATHLRAMGMTPIGGLTRNSRVGV